MTNPALQTISQEEFVSYLTSEQPHIPLYFPISVEHNKTGNRSIEEAKKMIAIVGIESLETNKGIIDTRPSLDYLKYKYP
jgi:hypothetical protein